MKLLMCHSCGDIFALTVEHTECSCGVCSGHYLENKIDAYVYMPDRTRGTVLGFANSSVVSAVRTQQDQGDLPATMPYCGRVVSPGRDFKAFVIPESADSVQRFYSLK